MVVKEQEFGGHSWAIIASFIGHAALHKGCGSRRALGQGFHQCDFTKARVAWFVKIHVFRSLLTQCRGGASRATMTSRCYTSEHK